MSREAISTACAGSVIVSSVLVYAIIEEAHSDDPDLASYLRIEERELEAGGTDRLLARERDDVRVGIQVTARCAHLIRPRLTESARVVVAGHCDGITRGRYPHRFVQVRPVADVTSGGRGASSAQSRPGHTTAASIR